MTASTVATQIDTKVAAAVTAMEAGDYSTALVKLLGAKALLSSLPSRSAKNGTELEYDAAAIDSLILEVKRMRGASHGVVMTPVEYARTPNTDD